ncbi:hypothetical protein C8R43DRAFT_885058 [Mycena crocata]|nr:hypothetical protein C8R43DRAFT_885058 [Mycena crocata]
MLFLSTICVIISTIDILQQAAPRVYSHMKAQLEKLAAHSDGLVPPFPDSAFTTAKFSFVDGSMRTRRTHSEVFHGFRALTVLGKFNPDRSSICILPNDNLAFRCPPGSTFLLPGSVTDYYFSGVKKGEQCYLFEQFFHAGIDRYIERGFRSDARYDRYATAEEKAAVEGRLADRVKSAKKLFSRLSELYV